ncbi:fructose-1,6-bisphosphatase/inositol monophosphatase family enzyme [Streptococcus rupicaprae]|uniref:Fructose-1,6-bisphosphatase/inositol monophosphatase family enzyme n=1 Tax=Streptococcus rupicaprae TaxID=759619 RepID=A0ABV2FGP2_9STRE
MVDLKQIDEQLRRIILDIGRGVRESTIAMAQIEEKKNHRDLVTNVDKEVQELLKTALLDLMPDTLVFGEESKETVTDFNVPSLWIIDPIDGTSNFVKQHTDYAIMLAYFEHLEPKLSYIYDVERDILYWSVEGQGFFVNGKQIRSVKNKGMNDSLASIFIRKFIEHGRDEYILLAKESFDVRFGGSLGIDGARVATGQFGAFISPRIAPWDFAPFFLFAKELDLQLSDFDGKPLDLHQFGSIILSTKQYYADWKKFQSYDNIE